MNDYYGTTYDDERPKKNYPMKWHKFLIYFSLWISAIMNVVTAITTGLGRHYGANGEAAYVYAAMPGMRIVDIAYAIVLIIVAVLCIVTRFSLARYKTNGPALLTIIMAINAVCALVYPFAASGISGLPFTELVDVPSVVSSIFYLVVNKVYYGKRSELFVN